jgi:hypothetical protein
MGEKATEKREKKKIPFHATNQNVKTPRSLEVCVNVWTGEVPITSSVSRRQSAPNRRQDEVAYKKSKNQ